MPTFKDLDKLMGFLEVSVIENMDIIGEEIRNKLMKNVKTLWYNRSGYEPSLAQYQRTEELINSITANPVKKEGTSYSVKIYFDPNKMNMYPKTNNEWSMHESMTGKDIRTQLPFYIEEGNGDSPYYQYEGVHPVEITLEEMGDNFLKNRIIKYLRSEGWKVYQ